MRPRIFLVLLLALLFLLPGCSSMRRPTKTSEVPRHLTRSHTVAVMPFTQPRDASELIMGFIPEGQGLVPNVQLAYLDVDLQEKLRKRPHPHNYSFAHVLSAPFSHSTRYKATAQPRGLEAWAEVAKKSGKDYILVPQIIDWRERDGSESGVTHPAYVRMDFFLIRSATGTVQNRVVWEEEQVGLIENLLTMDKFVKRKGAWVTARRLANDGMDKLLNDLGL